MRLRGIDFGPCQDASGLRGFFGQGYWFHHLFFWWYDFSDSTFVAKSTKTKKTAGNMRLNKDFEPFWWFPKCIWVNLFRGIALNAVGLGGPGAEVILREGFKERRWSWRKPFMISHAPEGKTPAERIKDVGEFARILNRFLDAYPSLRYIVGLQVNLSCPNSSTDPAELAQEAETYLHIFEGLRIVVGVKINLLVPVPVIKQICAHPACDFLCISNTVPFGQLAEFIPWKTWFPRGSPLATFRGGGGLSGKPLLPLLIVRIQEIRRAGIKTPINAGGGILSKEDLWTLYQEALLRPGIDSIFIGSIAMLRPWNIKPVIAYAHRLLA